MAKVLVCGKCGAPARCKGLCKKHYDEQRLSDPAVRARAKEKKKLYLEKNRARISAEYKEWYAGKGREYDRDKGLRARYGIGIAEYNKIFAAQEGRCAICRTESPGGDNYHFHVDHSHVTGEIRGLLCNLCNMMLGTARDSVQTLERAIEYMKNFPEPTIKQVIVIRRKYVNERGEIVGIRAGKAIAQAAHASAAWLIEKVRDGGRVELSKAQRDWLSSGTTKVVVRVDTEEELLAVYQKAVDAGLNAHLITDAGKTEFNGVPTKTCIAIGPDYADQIDPITKDLTLY